MADAPELPIAISEVNGKYLLFDIQAVSWLRRYHQLCGAFVGTLPQNPAQNVFLGLPVQIMPEEAQLLVEKGIGRIADEEEEHNSVLRTADIARREDYLARLKHDAEQISSAKAKEKEQERQKKLKQGNSKKARKTSASSNEPSLQEIPKSEARILEDEETTLFDSTSTITPSTSKIKPMMLDSRDLYTDYSITPTTSSGLLPTPPKTPSTSSNEKIVANLPSSYPLYRHLHNHGYFMTPGLRFGCQYCVYPGDPLRFHSHFLATGVTWDEEIDLMDIVAGGRLGTGVKKGFLIGGEDPDGTEETGKGSMRTYSIEWAGM